MRRGLILLVSLALAGCKSPPDATTCKQLVRGSEMLALGLASIIDPTNEEREAYRLSIAELAASGAELGCVFTGTLLEQAAQKPPEGE